MSSHTGKKRKVEHEDDEHVSLHTDNQESRPRANREKLQQRLNKALRRNDTLEHDLKVARAEREVALTRLSAMMSVKLRDNNPNIADLSDANRPTNLAMMFSELYDNEWTDAFTVINSVYSERQTITFLLGIVMCAYSFCSEELDRAWQMMSEWYLDDSLPNRQSLCKLLKDSRKVAVLKMTQRISERYLTHLQKLCAFHTLRDMLSSGIMTNYVMQSVKLCLLMCANDPPVVISCEDSSDDMLADTTSAFAANKASGDEETDVRKKNNHDVNASINKMHYNQKGQVNVVNTNIEEIIHMEMKKLDLTGNVDYTFSEICTNFESKLHVQHSFQRRSFQRPKFREYTTRGPFLEYVVWPVMYLHQGGPLLGKGVAQGTSEALGRGEEETWTWKKTE